MTVTYISIQISLSLGITNHLKVALIIQTITYFFSTPILINFVRSKFIYILKNIPSEMSKYLIILGLVEFATICMLFVYVRESSSSSFWILMTVILMALTAAISYHLIYIIVKNFMSTKTLKHLAYTDDLTGTKNRLVLLGD